MSWGVSVADTVAGWCKETVLTKVNSKEGEWLIQCSAVHDWSPNDIFNSTIPNWWCKAKDKTKSMWILPRSFSSLGAEVVENTAFVKIVVIVEVYELRNLGWHHFAHCHVDLLIRVERYLCLCGYAKHLFDWCSRHSLAHHWLLVDSGGVVGNLVLNHILELLLQGSWIVGLLILLCGYLLFDLHLLLLKMLV